MHPSISMWSLDRAIASGSMNQVDFINWAAELELKYVELISYYMNQEDNLRAPNRHQLFVSESVSQIR